LVILLGSSALGLFVRPLLSERHRRREVIEFVQLVVAMVMTFAALVLGLLTSSVKSSFDKVGNDLRTVAGELIQLDRISSAKSANWNRTIRCIAGYRLPASPNSSV
jgi:hypothetical protein